MNRLNPVQSGMHVVGTDDSSIRHHQDDFVKILKARNICLALNLATSLGEAAPREALSWAHVLSLLASMPNDIAF